MVDRVSPLATVTLRVRSGSAAALSCACSAVSGAVLRANGDVTLCAQLFVIVVRLLLQVGALDAFDVERQQGLLGLYLAAGEDQQRQAQQRRNPAAASRWLLG